MMVGALAAAVLGASCSVGNLFAVFGGRPKGDLEGLAETFGGKWYGCGSPTQYLDLVVDGVGSVSGQAVVDGEPILAVSGQVLEIFEEKGIVREATASLEMVPLKVGAGGRFRFDQVGAAGSMLRGIKGTDGAPVLMVREPDPAIRSCPGLQGLASGSVTDSGRTMVGIGGAISGDVNFGTPAPTTTPGGPNPSPSPSPTARPTPRPSPTTTPVTVIGEFQFPPG